MTRRHMMDNRDPNWISEADESRQGINELLVRVTLASGEVYSAEYKKLPAHWKSVAIVVRKVSDVEDGISSRRHSMSRYWSPANQCWMVSNEFGVTPEGQGHVATIRRVVKEMRGTFEKGRTADHDAVAWWVRDLERVAESLSAGGTA